MTKTLKIIISVFLAVLMIVGCICVGTVAPSAVAEGACLMLATDANWLSGVEGDRYAACFYTWNGSANQDETWVDMTDVITRENNVYFLAVPKAPTGKAWANIKFCYMKKNKTDNNSSNIAKATSVISLSNIAGNCYWLSDSAWHMYTGTPTPGNSANAGITINDAIPGQTYKAYRLMDIESYAPVSGAYSYKANSSWSTFLNSTGVKGTYVNINSQGYITWKDSADAAAFAKLAQKYANDNKIAPTATQTAPAAAAGQTYSTVTFSLGDKLGYYLVDTTLGTLCSLDTTNPQVVIEEKNDVPKVEKMVYEGTTWQKYNDASIDDLVQFKTVIHAKKGAQNYVLHDQMDSSFTFNSSSVSIAGLTKDTHYTVKTSDEFDKCTFDIVFKQTYLDTITGDTDIVVTYNATFNSKAKLDGAENVNKTYLSYGDPLTVLTSTDDDPIVVFKEGVLTGISTSSVKNITVTASGIPTGKEMEVFYGTSANNNFDSGQVARVASSGTHEQDFVFTFTGIKNWSGSLTKLRVDPFDTQEETEKLIGTRCSIKKVVINFNDGSSKVFDLRNEASYKQNVDYTNDCKISFDGAGSFVTEVDQTVTKTWTIPIYKFTNYNGSKALAGAEFELYYNSNKLKFQQVNSATGEYRYNKSQNNTTLVSASNGKITLKGLDGGQSYLLKETNPPAGYNKLAGDITITVAHDGKISISGGGTLNNNTVQIENKTGAVLPMTGGWGSVIFYAVDAAAILGIIAVIIVRRRRRPHRMES